MHCASAVGEGVAAQRRRAVRYLRLRTAHLPVAYRKWFHRPHCAPARPGGSGPGASLHVLFTCALAAPPYPPHAHIPPASVACGEYTSQHPIWPRIRYILVKCCIKTRPERHCHPLRLANPLSHTVLCLPYRSRPASSATWGTWTARTTTRRRPLRWQPGSSPRSSSRTQRCRATGGCITHNYNQVCTCY